MAHNPLADPWLQSASYITLEPRPVVIPAGDWALIADVQSGRATLTVLRGNFTDPLFVSPIAYGTSGVIAATSDPKPIQVHMSEYPLQICGRWYAYSVGGQTVQIQETLDRTPGGANVHARPANTERDGDHTHERAV